MLADLGKHQETVLAIHESCLTDATFDLGTPPDQREKLDPRRCSDYFTGMHLQV